MATEDHGPFTSDKFKVQIVERDLQDYSENELMLALKQKRRSAIKKKIEELQKELDNL